MKLQMILLIILMGLSGCTDQIENFVGGARRPGSIVTPSMPPSLHSTGPGHKLSPGANVVAGTQVRSQFSITPTQRRVSGLQVKSTFTIQGRSTQ